MVIAYYTETLSVDAKYLGLYEGEDLDALYLDGSRRKVRIVGGKAHLVLRNGKPVEVE